MKRFFLMALAGHLTAAVVAQSLQPPVVQCLKVLSANDKIRVTWENSADCAKFEEYRIVVNGQEEAWTLNHNAGDQENFCMYGSVEMRVEPSDAYTCHIVAVDSNGSEAVSNTIRTLPLNDVTVNVDSSLATISWEAPSTEMGQSWGDYYFLYRKREFETDFPDQPFATVPISETSYTDTADVCYADVAYQVGITNFYGPGNSERCLFMSGIGVVELVDRTKPVPPVLDSVSTTEDNRVMLGFHSVEEPMMAYIVYADDGVNGWLPLDTVGGGATVWIDPAGGAACYRIAVLDSCGNCSEIISGAQCNMIVSPGNADACRRTADLSWNGYANMAGGVDYYEVFFKEDTAAAWQSAGTTTQTDFRLEQLHGTGYTVFVRAYGINGGDTVTASSNRAAFSIDAYSSNDFCRMRSVSVEDNSYLEISVYTSGDTLPFNALTLQKSGDGQNFADLQTLGYGGTDPAYVFVDKAVDVQHNTYYYRAVIKDHCDILADTSDVMHNILLSGESTTAQENDLKWGNYAVSCGGGDQYLVFRKTEADTDFVLLSAAPPADVNLYADDVAQLYGTGSKFEYYVQARREDDGYGTPAAMTSNRVSLRQQPNTYVPNAFAPYSIYNPVFKPVNSFVPTDNYLFAVYSRTGQLIFMTRDPFEGWNGTLNNNGGPLPMDVYMYRITYTKPDGGLFQKSGSVTLLH